MHFALMGKALSVLLWFETVFPLTTESDSCRWLFCNILLKTNGRDLHRFQGKLFSEWFSEELGASVHQG